MIGTIMTLIDVKNAFLDGVVYSSPNVCKAKAINNIAPNIEPFQNTLLEMSRSFLLKITANRIVANVKRSAINCMTLQCSKPTVIPTKPLPHMIAVISINNSPLYFFMKNLLSRPNANNLKDYLIGPMFILDVINIHILVY